MLVLRFLYLAKLALHYLQYFTVNCEVLCGAVLYGINICCTAVQRCTYYTVQYYTRSTAQCHSTLLYYASYYCTYSGFHLDPELASRDEGAPREGRTRGAVGGIAPVVTTSRHKPSSEFRNIGF
jgi:hypothetical protein